MQASQCIVLYMYTNIQMIEDCSLSLLRGMPDCHANFGSSWCACLHAGPGLRVASWAAASQDVRLCGQISCFQCMQAQALHLGLSSTLPADTEGQTWPAATGSTMPTSPHRGIHIFGCPIWNRCPPRCPQALKGRPGLLRRAARCRHRPIGASASSADLSGTAVLHAARRH